VVLLVRLVKELAALFAMLVNEDIGNEYDRLRDKAPEEPFAEYWEECSGHIDIMPQV
jgi:hypothetical protein